MPSNALQSFLFVVQEIKDLEKANPSPTGASPSSPSITRAIGRSCVVLLSSHFERYLHAINEEAANIVNQSNVNGRLLPELLRLRHSKMIVDEIEKMQWNKRSNKLKSFVRTDAWLWKDGINGILDHKRLISVLNSPKPRKITQYYKQWDIADIFTAITRKTHNRNNLWLRIEELVDKRNNIAHGDPSTEATQKDMRNYLKAVKKFCDSADKKLALQLKKLLRIQRPW